MKKHAAALFIIVSLFLNFSCANNSLSIKENNYSAPKQINHPRLLYPRAAQKNLNTGTTKLVLLIDNEGKVSKVVTVKSSGSDIFDRTAVNYCKELEFVPAKIDGSPVASNMKIEIKFEMSNDDKFASDYVIRVNDLYVQLFGAAPSVRKQLEEKVLKAHNDFVKNMRDGLNFNSYMARVISDDIVAEWKKDWNICPLSFLVYYDFIRRFPDYDNLEYVKRLMMESLKDDVKYLNNTGIANQEEKALKESLLNDIRNFMIKYFPDINSDGIDLGKIYS